MCMSHCHAELDMRHRLPTPQDLCAACTVHLARIQVVNDNPGLFSQPFLAALLAEILL